jgi:PilZ domain
MQVWQVLGVDYNAFQTLEGAHLSSGDRRLGARRPASVKAMVTHDRVGLTKCVLREIGTDGAFVETGEFHLKKGADVDLVLKIRDGSKRTHLRVPAKVVRTTEDGAALSFDKIDENVYRILFDIVYPG